jgi:hypothetical protein
MFDLRAWHEGFGFANDCDASGASCSTGEGRTSISVDELTPKAPSTIFGLRKGDEELRATLPAQAKRSWSERRHHHSPAAFWRSASCSEMCTMRRRDGSGLSFGFGP